jgi:predicted acetyltransferase
LTSAYPHDGITFEEPNADLQDSYRGLVREFIQNGEPLVPFPLAFANDDFPAFLARVAACARGEGLPKGFVPHSTYWLVRDGRDVVGVSNLRHRLTDNLRIEGGHIGYGVRPSARRQGYGARLLSLTLERARTLGLREVLLTCAKNNEASVRTILRNRGVYLSEGFVESCREIVQRYRISLGT